MGKGCGQACDQPSTSTGVILEAADLTPNETAIFTAYQFGAIKKQFF